jgi:GH15 family glucan-1,4-alpha-glucosidase
MKEKSINMKKQLKKEYKAWKEKKTEIWEKEVGNHIPSELAPMVWGAYYKFVSFQRFIDEN